MIVTRLIGGLGNQMFQYAVGRALALRRGTELALDLSAFAKPGRGTPRQFALDAYELPVRLASAREIVRLKYGSAWRAKLKLRQRATYLREGVTNVFDPAVLRAGPETYLRGYWQTEKYFLDAREQLVRDFAPRGGSAPGDLMRAIEALPSVAVHVRRGDYLTDPRARASLGACSLDYYARAGAHLRQALGEPAFFVFSDDIAWAKANLTLPGPTTFVSRPEIADADELLLMSRCRHQVVANSSFSWWGAWLNQNPSRLVIAPRQWFRRVESNSPDLVPESWTRL